MKIKHWQGYGTVDAVKAYRYVKDGYVYMSINVTGDHEWGLVCDDEYDLKNWLIKRFDKNFKDQKIQYSFESGDDPYSDNECCVYYFVYKEE